MKNSPRGIFSNTWKDRNFFSAWIVFTFNGGFKVATVGVMKCSKIYQSSHFLAQSGSQCFSYLFIWNGMISPRKKSIKSSLNFQLSLGNFCLGWISSTAVLVWTSLWPEPEFPSPSFASEAVSTLQALRSSRNPRCAVDSKLRRLGTWNQNQSP